jgi:hypothetical protein
MTKPMLNAWNDRAAPGETAWLALLAGMLEEVWEVAAPEEASAFLRAVGARLVEDAPLEGLGSNEEILATINAFWADRGWGTLDLAFAEDGLRLHHGDLPPAPEGVAVDRWQSSIAAVLTGAYDSWLAALGGGPAMHTRLVAIRGDAAEFLYA